MSNPIKVLVIDDDIGLQTLWGHYLKQVGVVTMRAFSIADALVKMGEIPPPDIVFLDLHLPDSKNAKHTLTYISRIKEINPDAWIIPASGFGEPEIRDMAEQLGAADFFDKQDFLYPSDFFMRLFKTLNTSPYKGRIGAERTLELLERLSHAIEQSNQRRYA